MLCQRVISLFEEDESANGIQKFIRKAGHRYSTHGLCRLMRLCLLFTQKFIDVANGHASALFGLFGASLSHNGDPNDKWKFRARHCEQWHAGERVSGSVHLPDFDTA